MGITKYITLKNLLGVNSMFCFINITKLLLTVSNTQPQQLTLLDVAGMSVCSLASISVLFFMFGCYLLFGNIGVNNSTNN